MRRSAAEKCRGRHCPGSVQGRRFLLFLDEPTAALDPLSEYEIYSHFDDLVRDKTSILYFSPHEQLPVLWGYPGLPGWANPGAGQP